MAYEAITYEVTDGIAWLTMNRPDKMNALDPALATEIAQGAEAAARDESVRCFVLTGAGRGFCAGADLSMIEPFYERGEAPPVGAILRERYNPMLSPLVRMEKPTIAMVNGSAAGAGASLALACDFRIASEKAKFFQAFVKIGLVPDSGANYFLPRLVGLAKAMELAMLGDIIDANEAYRLGLVTKVVAPDKLADETREFAQRLAAMPTKAIGLTRRTLLFGADNPLDATLDFEADIQEVAARTQDHTEGVKAFLEKRAPEFRGR